MTTKFSYSGNELELFSKAKNWKNYMAEFIKPHVKGRVLEVGAGLGSMTAYLNHPNTKEWVLLEPDIEMAKLLVKKISKGPIDKNISVINGTVESLGDSLFDTIVYIDVLEHIENDKYEISNAAKLLAAGGKLIVLSPAYQFLFSPFDKAIGHYRRYTKKDLRNTMTDVLNEDSIRYLDTTGFFSALANKWLLKQDYPTERQISFWDNFLIPISYVMDRLFYYSFGKSILAVWKKTSVGKGRP